MIIRDSKNLVSKLHGDREIVRKYHGDRLVWERNGEELPLGYKKCKYIRSNGKQRIETNWIAKNDATVNVDVLFHSLYTGDGLVGPCISAVWRSDNRFYAFIVTDWLGRTITVGYSTFVYGDIAANISVGKKHSVETILNNGLQQYTIDGVVVYKNNLASNITTNTYLPIFAINNGGFVQYSIASLYSFCVDTPNGIVLDLVPCIDENGKPCLYDRITKESFYNKGTGEFGYELEDGTYVAPI